MPGQPPYGTGDGAITLQLKPSPFWDGIDIALVWEGKKSSTAVQRDLTVQLDDQEPVKSTVLIYGGKTSQGTQLTIHRTSLPIESFAKMRRAGRVRFHSPGLDLTLTLQQLPQVGETLQKCIEELQEIWNVGSLHASRLKQPPTPLKPLPTYFSADDYPADALINHQGGTTVFVLLIDEQGKVADCSTARTSGIASLDAQSCLILMKRGEFTPAVGRDGKPTKGIVSVPITWKVG